ncbi:MAG TPA: hypothetical protein VGN10_16150 [Pyrinomonadaceae bacterium]|jgi:hypothetical protein
MANPNPHIRIRHSTGGLRGEDLKELHFQETPSDKKKFHLFKGKEQIHTVPEALSSGDNFGFVFKDWCWAITQFWILDLKSTGNWLSKSCDGNDDPETGTYQAQGGPGMEAELRKTASGAVK